MRVVIVIPARYGSKRFPGKPLAKILSKPMIEWVIEGVKSSKYKDEIILATDDIRIREIGDGLGVRVALVKKDVPSGTDRVYEAIKDESWDIIVNVQGDEPLIKGEIVDTLVEELLKDERADLTTLAVFDRDPGNENKVKVVTDKHNYALYFSRSPIPYFFETNPCYLIHKGVYVYKFDALKKFVKSPPSELEKIERLEQLRALEIGLKIKVVPFKDLILHPVDVPEDILIVEEFIKREWLNSF